MNNDQQKINEYQTEILKSTLSQQVNQCIQLQALLKIANENINYLQEKNDKLVQENLSNNIEIENLKTAKEGQWKVTKTKPNKQEETKEIAQDGGDF